MLSTIIAGFKLLYTDSTDDEAGHLIDVVRLQAVTRGQAKAAAQNENPLSTDAVPKSSLIDLIFKYQGTDPLCIRLHKELKTSQGHESRRLQPDGDRVYKGTSLKGYTLDQRGILYYRERLLVLQ